MSQASYFRRRTTTVLTVVFVLCVVAALALVLLAVLGNDGGLPAGAALALIPVGPVVGVFLWLDRWEAEPPKLLLAAFGWGASVAALTALAINSTADYLVSGGTGDVPGTALVSAPLVEEAVKAAFVLGIWLFLRAEFDGVIDGVVYAGITAAGFAFTENITYFGRAFDVAGLSGEHGALVETFIVRGVFSPFAHPLFTVMTGIGIGIAAASRRKHRWLAPILGYALAVGLHAAWNASATFGGMRGFVWLYLLVMVPVGIGVIVFLGWQRRREQHAISSALPWMSEAGWIAPSEVELLASLRGRKQWRKTVAARHGRQAGNAVREYQAAVTELAFLRRSMGRGLPAWQVQQRTGELLAQLDAAAARVRALATVAPRRYEP
ncbi:PrsW family intramembrane metalloprotease [Sciscionella marina]|uniref:PrsW family intramembrane metalloprotease n=1 Tax=Sciscionella marina TaxID=508770 RepID=UPI000378D6F4|nr:PrsW family intramembrane metalloprotease [Sciscionella marina]